MNKLVYEINIFFDLAPITKFYKFNVLENGYQKKGFGARLLFIGISFNKSIPIKEYFDE